MNQLHFVLWARETDRVVFELIMKDKTQDVGADIEQYPEVKVSYIKWRMLGEPKA